MEVPEAKGVPEKLSLETMIRKMADIS